MVPQDHQGWGEVAKGTLDLVLVLGLALALLF